MNHHDHKVPREHDLGLSHDLPTVLNSRRALGLLSAAGLAAVLAACGGAIGGASTSPSERLATGDGATRDR